MMMVQFRLQCMGAWVTVMCEDRNKNSSANLGKGQPQRLVISP